METRKVQTVGGGTYTVSLPKEWAESQGVTAGEAVSLHTHIDGVLVVRPRERADDGRSRTTIRVAPDDPDCLERTLRAAYAAGSTSVTLEAAESFAAEGRHAVERIARNLPGTTVATESETSVTVRIVLDADEVSVRQSVRHLQFVALSMHREATDALAGEASAEWSPDGDDGADREFALVDRYFARGLSRLDEIDALGVTRPELFGLWVTARELERVGDHAEAIGRIAALLDEPVTGATGDEIRDVAGAARDVVEDAVRVGVGDADAGTARRTLRARDRVRARSDALDRRLFESSSADYRLAHVVEHLRRTAEHGGNVAEHGLRRAIGSDDPGTG